MMCLFYISHERDYPDSGSVYTGHDSGGECGVPYNHRWNFAMPHPTPSKLDETWWSVNYGPIHWITMSTEHAFRKGSAQHNWIMEDLKKVDRKITPFIIFCTWKHRGQADELSLFFCATCLLLRCAHSSAVRLSPRCALPFLF